jgi:hypothetical protein
LLLAEGAAQAGSPFHTPTLTNLGPAGPEARTVVLRAVDRASRTLAFHTDWRSPKRHQIECDPRLAWVFYDRARRVQLRARGVAALHHRDDSARSVWDQTKAPSRVCYATPHPPGTPIPEPLPAPTDADSGWDDFCVVRCTIERLDLLLLAASGHRRVLWRHGVSGWHAHWIVP